MHAYKIFDGRTYLNEKNAKYLMFLFNIFNTQNDARKPNLKVELT